MKQILIIVLTMLCGYIAKAQPSFIPQPIGGAPTMKSIVRGAFKADSSLAIQSFADTNAANRGTQIRMEDGILIKVGESIYIRHVASFKWVLVNTQLNVQDGRILFSANGSVKDTTGLFYNRATGNVSIGGPTVDSAKLRVWGKIIAANKLLIHSGKTSDSTSIGIGDSTLMSYTGIERYNTAVGPKALKSSTSGASNSAFGWGALLSNTTGSNNTALGVLTLTTNTSGINNIAIGTNAMQYNTTGLWNVASGINTLRFNTSGGRNTALGAEALNANTTGSFNTAVGHNAMLSSNGDSSTALGKSAGYSSTGGSNVFLGTNAGYTSTGGNHLVISNINSATNLVWGKMGTVPFFGINTPYTSPDTVSSIFAVNSTTKGALLPRMTSAQMLAIASPAQGLVVFCTDSTGYCEYTGTAWLKLRGGSGGAGTTETASNGLNKVVNDIQLGGPLTSNTVITGDVYTLTLNANQPSATAFTINQTNTGVGMAVFSPSNIAGYFSSGYVGVLSEGAGIGGQFTGNATGLIGSTTNPGGLPFKAYYATNEGTLIKTAAKIARIHNAGIPSNGFGVSIDYGLETSTTGEVYAGALSYEWVDAVHATRTSEFNITGVNSGTTNDLFTLNGSGAARLPKYGINTFTGTATYNLAVDASGNIIEVALGGGGGVSSVASTPGLGLTFTGTTPITSTGTITFGLDTANASVLSRQRAAATYQPLISLGDGRIVFSANGIPKDTPTLGYNRATGDIFVKTINIGRGGGDVTTNTAMGWGALRVTSSDDVGNTAIGALTMYDATNTDEFTAVGNQALFTVTSGTGTTGIGSEAARFTNALASVTSVSSGTYLGYRARATNGGTNEIVIGANALANGSNTSTIGTSSTTDFYPFGSMSLGTTTPQASALLNMSSTTKGFLLPRMNTTEQNAISSPANGLLIYNTDSLCLVEWNGTYWLKYYNISNVPTGGGSGDMILANSQTNTGNKTFLNGTLLLRNVANTFNGVFTNTNTADRTYTLQNANGTLAFLSDITGTNSGVNTGDNAVNSLYSGLVSNATHTGDATGATALTVVGINGTLLSGLATGLLKNTTGTGVPSIAVGGTDYTVPGATFFIGTTSIANNRASASQALTGITSIDGNAATVTTNANLTGPVTSIGNATTIEDGTITNDMLIGSIDLGTKMSGLLAKIHIANADNWDSAYVRMRIVDDTLHIFERINGTEDTVVERSNFNLTTSGSGAATWDPITQTLNIPVGGSGLTYTNLANGYLNRYGNFVAFNTDSIAVEGSTNLWYTDARARAAITGTTNRITVSSGVVDISASYVGQSSITTLGTIGTGTWQGTAIGTAYGGVPSGGTTGQVLAKNSNTNYDYSWTASGSGGGLADSIYFFKRGGNVLTAGAFADKLGTLNNVSLRFMTNGLDVAVLDSNQRFGVGIVQPLEKMHLVGKFRIHALADDDAVISTYRANGTTIMSSFINDESANLFRIQAGGAAGTTGNMTFSSAGVSMESNFASNFQAILTVNNTSKVPLDIRGIANTTQPLIKISKNAGTTGDMFIQDTTARVGINNATPAVSSIFDITSTTRGLLIPRLNTTQQNAISSPATGLMIINTDSGCITQYNGTYWLKYYNISNYPVGGGSGDMILASAQTNTGAKTFLDASLLLRNVANTFSGKFTNTITADRTYTLKDADGTIAFTSDITGTNSGTNTGDQTSIVGITGTLAQFNTAITDGNIGDMFLNSVQTVTAGKTFLDATFALRNVANTFSGVFTNTITAVRTWTLPDATGTIALTSDITGTNSGTNTGDQTNITGNAGTATALQTARAIYGNNFDGTAALTQIIASTYGGTGNGFTKFSGPTSTEKTFTLPDANTTLVGTTATQTLENKRVTRRYPTVTQSATPTINTDNTDGAHITGLAQAITSMTTNLSGTPTEGQFLHIDITDDGTARAITWGSSFEASTVALPTTTVISTRLDMVFVWNSVTSKWRILGAQ